MILAEFVNVPGTLLHAKLFVPPLRPNIVVREWLIKQLEQDLQPGHKLTLISAPAGFGKTTLVAAFVQNSHTASGHRQTLNSKFAWLSLDENDNDLTRFLAYIVAALQTALGDIGETVVSLLNSPQSPPTEAVVNSLINEIAETNTGYCILVLDDYHLITSREVNEAIAYLLENMPPFLHLVILTRADPSLPLARWRARGQMTGVARKPTL